MSEKIIAVDIDEVLAETIKSMLEKHNYTRK
jgi:5'(3')-deoxyribonucleotidase